jgi:tRNA (guanine37-N1)-methyltransferase
VPDILLSGDHAAIARWRRREAYRRTAAVRPELISLYPPSEEERAWAEELAQEQRGGDENAPLSAEEPRTRP